MKVIRFMDSTELETYLSGKKLRSRYNHAMYGNLTDSVGFCFAEITPERDADKWLRKLMGIRTCQWVVEFETDKFRRPFVERRGVYADDVDFENKRISVREWSTIVYSLRNQPWTRIGKCPDLMGILNGKKIEWLEAVDALCLSRKMVARDGMKKR